MTARIRVRRATAALALALVLLGTWARPAAAELKRDDLGWYTFIDEDGRVVLETGLLTRLGDQYIAEDNRRYEVVAIDGDTVQFKFLGVESLELSAEEEALLAAAAPAARPSLGRMLWSRVLALVGRSSPAQGGGPTVCMYSTHSEESYEPTDGTASARGPGGIYRVGDALKAALERNGVRVIYDRAVHFPRDAGSYDRSRPTALRCIQRHQPAAIVDVHRDTAPPEAYLEQVAGQAVTKVMLVVGRENPAFQQSLAYAKRVKGAVDNIHPGLMRGIFMARGKYNQDLHPRAVLAEVGAHKNQREHAEAGVALFGEALAQALGAAGAGGEARGGWTAVGWLLGLAVVGTGIYLWIATGSGRAAWAKLQQFVRTEWANAMGLGGRRAGAARRKRPAPRAGNGRGPADEGEQADEFLAGDDGIGSPPWGGEPDARAGGGPGDRDEDRPRS